MDLQWPHQGARNFTKAALPDSNTSLSKLSDVSSMVAVARKKVASMVDVATERRGLCVWERRALHAKTIFVEYCNGRNGREHKGASTRA